MGGASVSVTDATFQAEVIDSSLPVLVDFWAEWCGPCKMISPVLEELAVEYGGKLKVVKVDVDSNQQAPMQYQVRSIPTLLFFQKGQLVKQLVGAYPKNKLKEEIDHLLRG